MIYQIDSQKVEVSIQELSSSHMYAAMMNMEELKENYQALHISQESIERCEEKSSFNQNVIIPHVKYYYGLIHLINARDIFVEKDSFAMFVFENIFLIVIINDDDHHIENVFQSSSDYVLQQGVSITRLVYYFLSELIAKDYQYIEELQEELEVLENHDTDEESLKFTSQIRQLNKELLLLRNYYDNLVVIGEELQMNHHDILNQNDMRYFEIFTHRIERLSDNVQMLRELVNQAKDAHQSKLDYKLNKTMQFFTVVTTIFMPLTLIAGWYGMNFKNMPELVFPYGYYIVIGVSLVIVVGLILWFKKKKFL